MTTIPIRAAEPDLFSLELDELRALANSKLHNITETFYSIQGEGARAGRPAYFIRYGKCNFRCSWCDSSRTWENDKEQTADSMIEELLQSGAKSVVVTGGEPMLYARQTHFKALLLWLKKSGFHIEIESDAAINAQPFMLTVVDQWNLSPKIGSSGVEMTTTYQKAIQAWVDLGDEYNIWFKFVVRDSADMAEVNKTVLDFNIPKASVFLMPEGNSIELQMQNMPYVVERCLVEGYNFAPRTHVLIWGGQEAK